jgi:hypothetical protein
VRWLARLTWIVLAFTSASALADATSGWSSAPRAVSAAGLWLAWGGGLLALLAPRPWGFTVLRVASTVAVGVALAATVDQRSLEHFAALAVAIVAVAIACSASVAHACADGAAYGYERRFPLRAPFALMIGGIPITAAVVAAGVGAGPLLLADRRWWWGAAATAIGFPAAALAVRALHSLDRRWLVVVPAGFVVADPLTLSDPVLLPSEIVAAVADAAVDAPPGALDLRLGTAFGGLAVRTREPGTFVRRAGRAEVAPVETDTVLVTPLRPQWFREALAQRREPAGR